MAKIRGYGGGDGEDQLKEALKKDFSNEQTSAWEKIRTEYMHTGSIIDIAVAREYTKKLGFKGWVGVNVGKGETHGRDCWNCWKKRHDFDRVVEWVESGNTDFAPSKLSGPQLYLESHKAWSERMLTDAEKLAKKTNRGKNKSAKELREEAARWRARYDRAKGVVLQWAQEDNREAREINAIEIEIAREEEEQEGGGAPVYANRPGQPIDNDGAVADDGQHPGDDADPDPVIDTSGGATEDDSAETEQHPGVVNDPDPVTGDDTPNFREVAAGLDAAQRRASLPPPAPVVDYPQTPEVLAEHEDWTMYEQQYGLVGFGGKTSADDSKLRSRRVSFYRQAGDISEDDAAVIRRAGKTVWRSVTTVQQVWDSLTAERAKQEQALADRLARKAAKKGAAVGGASSADDTEAVE